MNLIVERSSKSYKTGEIYERELRETSVSKCIVVQKYSIYISISLNGSTRWISSLE